MSEPITWTNERRKLRDLVPWERNPRQIRQDEARRLEDSLEKFGQIQTIAIGPDNEVYDGHQRKLVWAASQKFGANYEVDVRVSSRALTEREREQLVVYLHRGTVGEWDFDILSSFDVPDLLDWGFTDAELGLAGFDIDGFSDNGDVSKGAEIFDNEQIIDAAFEYFRRTGFPYRNLPIHVCMQELNKLAQTEPEKLIRSNTGYQVADTYHPHRFHASADGMKSMLEGFESDKLLRRMFRLDLQYGAPIGTGLSAHSRIVSGVQSPSNFRPGFACYLYRKFAQPGATVLDCSTGYGGRLVGFMASGIAGKYIGIDPNKPTHEGNLRMAQDLGFDNKVELYNSPAEDIDTSILAGRCDFSFTSPPYFAKEHYSDDDTQSWVRYKEGEDWRQGFLVPFMALQFTALKAGCCAIVNIADVKLRGKVYPLERWAAEAGVFVGFEHLETKHYRLTNRFGAGMNDEVATEPVLVFRKPSLAAR